MSHQRNASMNFPHNLGPLRLAKRSSWFIVIKGFLFGLFLQFIVFKERAYSIEILSFSNVPAAENSFISQEHRWERSEKVLKFFAQLPLPAFRKESAMNFILGALSRLRLGVDIDAVSQRLLDSGALPFGLPGSDTHVALCQRDGDYDFYLVGLVALAALDVKRGYLLSAHARQRLWNVLLTVRGTQPQTEFDLGICGTHAESENHILMTEVSRYLTNQIFFDGYKKLGQYVKYYDNSQSYEQWWVQHLKQFLISDFSEYNSRIYQGYSVQALEILYEFAHPGVVRSMAKKVLDYLSARFAIQSFQSRRFVPFRRLREARFDQRLTADGGQSARNALLVGDYGSWWLMTPPWTPQVDSNFMVMPALGSYKVPSPILDFHFERGSKPFFQTFHHLGVEVYSGSNRYLISGGGVHVPQWGWFTNQNDGWPVSTTVMGKNFGIYENHLIRFSGNTSYENQNNTCVYRNFACGLNPVIPSSIPESCQRKVGSQWTFINLTAPGCSLNLGFFAALFKGVCASSGCRGQNYGVLEIFEPHSGDSFDRFIMTTIQRNGTRVISSDNESIYTTMIGDEIRFVINPGQKIWPLVSVNHVNMERDYTRWPLARGDVFNVIHPGYLIFRNPQTGDEWPIDADASSHLDDDGS